MDELTFEIAFLTKLRDFIISNIAYAMYQIDGSWYRTGIQSIEAHSATELEVRFAIGHAATGTVTITGVALFDYNENRIASRTISVTREDASDGIMYVCMVRVLQVIQADAGTGIYDELGR